VDQTQIDEAARLLIAARRERSLLPALPEAAQPQSFADAVAVQDRTVALLGETISGYKIAGTDSTSVMWGAVLGSRVFTSPARVEAALVPLLGVEVEIAFRLDRDIAADDLDWTKARFDEAATALPLIEIVDTRFTSYTGTPPLHRAGDFMSNGGIVCGAPLAGWRSINLEKLAIRLSFSGQIVADVVGGHAAGDPRLPALAFLNAPLRARMLPRGTILTTGTYTGLLYAKPGDVVEADVGPFGKLRLDFTA
jgi:2-keto-4-pentenoate hydratase